ncbi:hypothetical protein [Robiginitomaculum antarcticum]|uniref:hypothetical protein n=1 Tax=Robiginitomaculum antarcticum TaxID=437507 RepID=UPI000477F90B|nr:hypothetical protein [Robiginitomaculum antarcticum]
MTVIFRIFTTFLAFCGSSFTYADSPLPAQQSYVQTSPDGTCMAYVNLETLETILAPHYLLIGENGEASKHWRVKGWHRWVHVADNCDYVVIGYGGYNLLSLSQKDKNSTVITYINRSGLTKTLKLVDLYSNLDVLPRTVSHWAWYEQVLWDKNVLMLSTVDNRKMKFEVPDDFIATPN